MYFGHSGSAKLESMLFPKCDRVIYRNNVLERVRCQLHFPAGVWSDRDFPAGFQKGMRTLYPISNHLGGINNVVDFPTRLQPEKATLPLSAERTHEFKSEDECWRVILSTRSVALECLRSYTTWKDFVSRLSFMTDVFSREFRPVFFDRVGLRYQNIICRSRLRVARVPWIDLLNPQIAGGIAPEIAQGIEEAAHIILLKLNEEGDRLRMNYGTVRPQDSGEECYRIENEFYSDTRTTTDDLANKLDRLHQESSACFRWCIGSALHIVMQPQAPAC